jgi:hypothetical protein
MRLRSLHCRRHIEFFQELFRSLKKFPQGLEVNICKELGTGEKLYISTLPLLESSLLACFISPCLIVELFGRLYPQLTRKEQSQLQLAAFL